MVRKIGHGAVFIFDVEGTLVDTVPMTIACWLETLESFGVPARRDDLQRLSGMDGDEMLQSLFPDLNDDRRKEISAAQGERYRKECLHRAAPFPGIRDLFEAIRNQGAAIALATDCQRDELRYYRRLLKADDLIDAAACGTEVPHGKPNPALLTNAAAKLGAGPGTAITMIGDTPFDAQAARSIGGRAIGLLTGGHSRSRLVGAGCAVVASTLVDLRRQLGTLRTDQPKTAADPGR